jgi:predicted PurR-regulated permease PerM
MQVLTPNPHQPPTGTGEYPVTSSPVATAQGTSAGTVVPPTGSTTSQFRSSGSLSSTSQQPFGYRLSLAILAASAAVALLYFGRVFFITVVIAIIIALLLDPVVLFFMKFRLGRGPASFVVCSLAVLFLYLGLLGLATEVASLAEEVPVYSERVTVLSEQAIARLDEFEKGLTAALFPRRAQKQQEPQPSDARSKRRRVVPAPVEPPAASGQSGGVQEVRIRPEPTPFYKIIYDYVSSLYNVLLMASFVPFLVYFMLAWRDHLRTRFISLFRGELRLSAADGWRRIADVARAYVFGNFLLGILLGVASSIFFASIRLPYWLLVGPVSGFLSLVPYLGLPLAIIPPMVAALPVHNDPAMYVFIVGVVSLLHLLALNLVYPKFVGSRVHLNPLVVTIALMFWGTLWGGIGLLLAVPITAAIKAVCDSVDSLKPYGKLMGD